MTFRLYVLQRLTAALMLPLIAGHLFVIVYAAVDGLTAAEILGRTRGSMVWALYYGLFVVLAAVHGAIGMRVVASEWLRWRGPSLDIAMWIFGGVLLLLGTRAVVAVVLPGGLQ